MLNCLRVEELTNDMSWRPGVPCRPTASKWITSVRPKAKSISFISKVRRYSSGKYGSDTVTINIGDG